VAGFFAKRLPFLPGREVYSEGERSETGRNHPRRDNNGDKSVKRCTPPDGTPHGSPGTAPTGGGLPTYGHTQGGIYRKGGYLRAYPGRHIQGPERE